MIYDWHGELCDKDFAWAFGIVMFVVIMVITIIIAVSFISHGHYDAQFMYEEDGKEFYMSDAPNRDVDDYLRHIHDRGGKVQEMLTYRYHTKIIWFLEISYDELDWVRE